MSCISYFLQGYYFIPKWRLLCIQFSYLLNDIVSAQDCFVYKSMFYIEFNDFSQDHVISKVFVIDIDLYRI